MQNSRLWTAGRDSELLCRSWDPEETVVYHAASGDTHLLNRVAAAVLRTMQRGPLGARDVAGRAAEVLGCRPDESFVQHVERLLVEFDELGLIEPAYEST